MDDGLRARLHDLALSARRLLTTEISSLLTAIYGLSADGQFEPVSRLPAVQTVPDVAETRRRLEQYVRDEVTAGRKAAAVVDRLIRETAFTHLNRFVAFKLLEARKLLRATLEKHHASNGFLYYLADHAEDEARYHAGDLPQDGLGEGPRDVAYRRFLLWQADQLAAEVPVLFDAANLASRLFPRPQVLRELIAALNQPELREAWGVGNEETIGWIYQYFNEEEKNAVFVRLNKLKQKIRREDLPAATQLFTPRWIVRFLVENTLGRHWLQMHPDSRLAAELEYLVPPAAVLPSVPLQPVRMLTLLDPACGAMHFGLVAFDLFAAMYREELERAGEPGWPAQPSVVRIDDIPAAILAHNLFGIDIDLRAVQLAALSLYVRAKTVSPKVAAVPRNLVCADVTVLKSARLDAFVESLRRSQPLVASALRRFLPQLEQAGEFGSLLRLEDDLRKLSDTRPQTRRSTVKPTLPGMEDIDTGSFKAFNDIDLQLRAVVNDFARQEAARGDDASAFVAGAEQGLKLFDLFARRYDVVVANPPYMAVRGMPPTIADYLKNAYPEGKNDLDAAFILRCAELLNTDGRLGMITQQSFMFISSYEKLREQIRSHSSVETMAHVGPRAFAEIGGEKVNTTLFTLRREPSQTRRNEHVGTYFRLVREPDAASKQLAFEAALEQLSAGRAPTSVFHYRQGDFDAIPGAPWVYWIMPSLQNIFRKHPVFSSLVDFRAGMHGGDLFRFGRFWWEVGISNIQRKSRSSQEFWLSGRKWAPYMKGGTFKRWWGNQEWVVAFDPKSFEILSFSGNKLPSRGYFFREGVTWSGISMHRFAARFSPGGFVFDSKGSSGFGGDASFNLGVLNSEFVSYALRLLNSTVSFQAGDLARLPVPTETSSVLNRLVERAISLARQDSVESETTYDFVAPPAWPNGGSEVAARVGELAAVEREIDEEVYRLYAISAEDRIAIEAELADRAPSETDSPVDEAVPSDEEEQDTATTLTDAELARRWVSYAIGVALGRFQPGVHGSIGCGRFAPELATRLRALADDDGLGVIESGHPDHLVRRVERVLELMVGEDEAHRLIRIATEARSLAAYLTGEFYRDHIRLYRKRPVYWLLQSPRKTFSLLVSHERLTGDSLPLILGHRYLQGRINALRGRVAELQVQIAAAEPGRARKSAERELDTIVEQLTDVEEFARLIRAVIERQNQRGEAVGWRPERDDGVLINCAPLFTLMPSWAAEPRKCWQALERGEFDWSHTAMRYWPDRVLAACRTNRSYAIAHGVTAEA